MPTPERAARRATRARTANARPRPTALITGASSGIGQELAREFAAGGHDLVVVARRRARLDALRREIESTGAARVRVLQADLCEAGAVARIRASLRGRRVDVLVNNAGTLEGGPFLEMPPERTLAMVQLNVLALVALTRAFVPAMVARGEGRVLNVASIAAFAPVPYLAVYAATKAFVLSFGEALVQELDGSGVSVTSVCPGLTDSEMADAALERAAALKPWRRWLFAPAASVARAAYAGCMAGATVVVPGTGNRLYDGLMQLAPRSARRRLTGMMGRALR